MTNGVYLPRRKRSVEPLWHRRQISLDGLNRREGSTDGDCTAGQPKVAALLRSVQRAKRMGRVNWLADSHGLDDFDYFAPLLLAGNAVVVSIHLDPRAILQEESRFLAGCHLRP